MQSTQPPFYERYEREIIIGSICLIIGYAVGGIHESLSYERAVKEKILDQIEHHQEKDKKEPEALTFHNRSKKPDKSSNLKQQESLMLSEK